MSPTAAPPRIGRPPGRSLRRALRPRLRTLLAVLRPEGRSIGATDAALIAQVAAALRSAGPDVVWLALSVITARLAEPEDVAYVSRLNDLDGPDASLAEIFARVPPDLLATKVEIVTDEVLVDINHLGATTLVTGIQRVTQRLVSRWHRDHTISMVRWTTDNGAIRRANAAETATALGRRRPRLSWDRNNPRVTVLVPWRATYVLPEVALEMARTSRLQALAQYGQCRTAAIGFDTVPLTSAETTNINVPAYFMHELAAIREMDRVACISGAAATEYEGWRTMVSSLGVTGPEIATVPLAVEVEEPPAETVATVRAQHVAPDRPLVLCVGSHEPRKNHLAVLHAAELLWRRGLEFSLLFVGGNAWRSDRFYDRLSELKAAGRPVDSSFAIADAELWALYRVAHCTIFPSLNEGFGLPVAESLASGTPVITSGHGSMRELGEAGGTLFVDPRNDHAIAEALDSMLTDRELHARLAREAELRSDRTWDDYARDAWDFMVETNTAEAERTP